MHAREASQPWREDTPTHLELPLGGGVRLGGVLQLPDLLVPVLRQQLRELLLHAGALFGLRLLLSLVFWRGCMC